MFKKFGKSILGSTALISSSSAATYLYLTKAQEKKHEQKYEITPDFIKQKYPHINDIEKFDFNWDGRQPLENKYAVKNIILIRHGQYDTSGETDLEQPLTAQGREQTRLSGERLGKMLNFIKKEWEVKLQKKLEKTDDSENSENSESEILARYQFPSVNIIKSTMTRARNTAEQVESELTKAGLEWQVLAESDNIREHRPYPYVGRAPGKLNSWDGKWEDEENYAEASLRIENGFKEFVHRSDESDKTESFDVICGHANVHRYFVFRALQLPPEGWLKTGLPHGSITWLRVYPKGYVAMRCFGDAGFIPVEKYTSSNLSAKEAKALREKETDVKNNESKNTESDQKKAA